MSQNDPNQISTERIKAFMASPAGQSLMSMVQKTNPKDLEAAKASAQPTLCINKCFTAYYIELHM